MKEILLILTLIFLLLITIVNNLLFYRYLKLNYPNKVKWFTKNYYKNFPDYFKYNLIRHFKFIFSFNEKDEKIIMFKMMYILCRLVIIILFVYLTKIY